jgi:putative ABC transport system substrate-binding protein
MSEPGGNVSGASQVVPLSAQIQAAMKLFEIKKLGLLFNPREKNTMIQREQINHMAEKFDFEVVDLRSPPALDRLERNLQRLADKSVLVDAVYLPFDSFLISKAKLIGSKLREARIKSIGATKAYIAGGALMGVVPDYHKLGEAVARILDRHCNGEKLGRIPVQQIYRTQAPTLVVNATTQAALGLDIPQAVLSEAVIVK